MKKIILSAVLVSLSSLLLSQNKKTVDSLAGFDYIGSHNHAGHAKSEMAKHHMMEQAKRAYINAKYNLNNENQITNPNGERSSAEFYQNQKNGSANKGPGNNNTLGQGNQPVGCTNIDFESNKFGTDRGNVWLGTHRVAYRWDRLRRRYVGNVSCGAP